MCLPASALHACIGLTDYLLILLCVGGLCASLCVQCMHASVCIHLKRQCIDVPEMFWLGFTLNSFAEQLKVAGSTTLLVLFSMSRLSSVVRPLA